MSTANPRGDDPVYLLLRRLFRTSSQGVLAASALSSGCVYSSDGSEYTVVPGPSSEPTIAAATNADSEALLRSTPTCQGSLWRPTALVAPTVQADYLAWRRSTQVRDESGQRCGGALDPRVCEAKIREGDVHAPATDWNVLSTTADRVEVWQGPGLLHLLGKIDTANEALMVAASRGYAVACYGVPNPLNPRQPQLNTISLDDGYEVWLTPHAPGCGSSSRYRLHVSALGALTELEREDSDVPCPAPTAVPGRRPPGLTRAAVSTAGVGARLSRDAHLEAASVHAFDILAHELALHGAPRALFQRARRAADDEVRHAVATTALAERFGARVPKVVVGKARTRSLADITLDNAVEGCVGEAFAALVATFQAQRSEDAEVRRAFADIAADETEHAAFSFRLHQWASRRLDESSRRRVRDAQRAELRRLWQGATDPHPEVARVLGLPTAREQHALLARLQPSIS